MKDELFGRLLSQEDTSTKIVISDVFEEGMASKYLKQTMKITVHFVVLIAIVLGGSTNAYSACGSVNYGAFPNNGYYYCVGTTTQRYNYCGNAAGTLTGLKNHPLMCTSAWSNSNLNTVQVCKNEKVTQCATLGSTTRCRNVYSRNTGWQWSPARNTICSGTSFTQTSNCGFTRTKTGTKNCDLGGDGVDNTIDQCPNTPSGESVNGSGCSLSQLDSDIDGVSDDVDQCPSTPTGEAVDVDGCGLSQLDTDNDGISDDADQCPGTPNGESVDVDGCAASQLIVDTDGDGIPDALDQ